MKSGDKIVLHNLTTGLPEVVQRQDRDPHGWLFWVLACATLTAIALMIREVVQ